MARASWIARTLLVGGGLVAGMGLAECTARIVDAPASTYMVVRPPRQGDGGPFGSHPILTHSPIPGFQGRSVSLEYDVSLRFNELGLRGPQVPAVEKGERWLVLGDSFVLARQVSEETSFVGRLNTRESSSFWNGGVDGYGTWDASVRFRDLAETLDPSGVLLLFFLGNDLYDNLVVPDGNSPPAGSGEPPPSGLFALLSGGSHLFAHLQRWQRMREFRSPDSRLRKEWAEQLSIFTREGSSELLRQAHRTDEALASLRRSTSARGDRLVVALAPASFQLDSQTLGSTLGLVGLNPELATPDAPSQALIRILQKQGIESCDLLPALAQAHQQGRTLHFPHDGHWTPEGHEVVAQALAGCLAL